MRLKGLLIDAQTRCEHYHSKLDIIAIKFKCCDTFYPCYQCHSACEDHEAERWSSKDFTQKAILCGSCKTIMSIDEYMQTDICPHCRSEFNPKCKNHYALYFEI